MKSIKFSEYFGLNKKQIDLDFVDIFINKDTKLFLDPWTFKNSDDEFAQKANYKIVTFFEEFLKSINNKEKALNLLGFLSEIKETRLGLGNDGYSGSSIGEEFSTDIYESFIKSKSFTTKKMSDIEDTVLTIDGIGPDRISDIITNIISDLLVDYTQIQCNIYGIGMKDFPGYSYWCSTTKRWNNKLKIQLPYIENYGKVLLVPKWYVRRASQYFSHTDIFNREILDFEQMNHLNSGSILCQILSDGSLKKPNKDILKEKIKISKELVAEYIDRNPGILEDYKKRKSKKYQEENSDEVITKTQGEIFDITVHIDLKINRFKEIKPGKADCSLYHNHILDCLNDIFLGDLTYPVKEYEKNDGRHRIDIKYDNSSNQGFFNDLNKYKIVSGKIFFECKNYKGDLKNPEYNQMLSRFDYRYSTIGFIVCRNIKNKAKSLDHCKDYVKSHNGYIIILDDNDIIQLLKYKKNLDKNKISKFLQDKLDLLLK